MHILHRTRHLSIVWGACHGIALLPLSPTPNAHIERIRADLFPGSAFDTYVTQKHGQESRKPYWRLFLCQCKSEAHNSIDGGGEPGFPFAGAEPVAFSCDTLDRRPGQPPVGFDQINGSQQYSSAQGFT